MNVQNIDYGRVDEVVDTLHEAFYDYPVMKFVLGADAPDFRRLHERMTRLFVMGRVYSKEPLFGIGDPNRLAAAAIVSLPETDGTPDALHEYRQQVWATFEPAARCRYDKYVSACASFDIDLPHHHLNMVGVRKAHKGTGLGRALVEHVIRKSDRHEDSHGVSLTTELASNVSFYERLGFEVTGHIEVAPGFETWNFFRQRKT